MERSEGDQIALGAGAEHLLNNDESFITACEDVRETLVDELLGTREDEKELREDIYKKISLLGEIVAELAAMYNIKEQLIARDNSRLNNN